MTLMRKVLGLYMVPCIRSLPKRKKYTTSPTTHYPTTCVYGPPKNYRTDKSNGKERKNKANDGNYISKHLYMSDILNKKEAF